MFTLLLDIRKHGESVFMSCPLGSGLTQDECVKMLQDGGMASFETAEVQATLIPRDLQAKCVKYAVVNGSWVLV